MQVLIFDSSMQIINGLENILSEAGIISKILKADSYEDALHHFQHNRPGVVLMEYGLDSSKSLALLKSIKETERTTRVILLYDQVDELMMKVFKDNGVNFFIDKYKEFEKLPGIIKKVAAIHM